MLEEKFYLVREDVLPEAMKKALDVKEMLARGKADSIRDLSAPDCETCRDLYVPIIKVHRAGGSFDNNGWRIDAANMAGRSGPVDVNRDVARAIASNVLACWLIDRSSDTLVTSRPNCSSDPTTRSYTASASVAGYTDPRASPRTASSVPSP
jgi:hypothetical protein